MIVLDNAGTRALSLINTQNGANVEVNFSDYTTTTGVYARGVPTLTTISSATTTSVCATPAASTIRDIDYVNIYNTYAGSQNFTVQITSGSGGPFILVFATLAQNESLNYTHGTGWCAMDANGNRKEALGTILPSLTVTGNATIGGTLGVTGVATFTAQPILSSLTASQAVFSDGSKGLVSNAITGSGSVVMSTSPQLTTSATTNSTTFSLINATATTVNFAGGASVALNIGHASGTNTILGATTFSQALTVSAGVTLSGTASNIALGSNYISNGGTDAGLSFDGSNVATFSGLVYGNAGFYTANAAAIRSYGTASDSGAVGPNVGVSDSTNFWVWQLGTSNKMDLWNYNSGWSKIVSVNASGMNGVLGATTPAAVTATKYTTSGTAGVSVPSASTGQIAWHTTDGMQIIGAVGGSGYSTSLLDNAGTARLQISTTGLFAPGTTYLYSSDSSNASLTLRKATVGADAIDYLQARDSSNTLIAKIDGSGNTTVAALSATTGAFSGAISGTGADNNIILSQNGGTQWRINNSNAGAAASALLSLQNGTASASVNLLGTGYTTNASLIANRLLVYNNDAAGIVIVADNASGTVNFAAGGLTTVATVSSTGLAVIGTGTFTKATAGDVVTFTNGGASNKTGYLYSDNTYIGLMNVAGAGAGDGFLIGNSGHIYGQIGGNTKLDVTSAGLAVTGTLSTTDPAGGAGPAWKLGIAASVSPTSPNRTLRVDIGGTSYYIAAKTTND